MYKETSNRQKQILERLRRKKNTVSWLRITLLLGAVYCFYLMMYNRIDQYGWIAIVLFVLFITAVNRYIRLQSRMRYHEVLKKVNDDEIRFLQGNHTFDGGSEFQNPQHAFSYDLDMFGPHSVFQFINRTGTWLGKKRLAEDLQHIPEADEIKQRQEAVKELSVAIEFRQHFQVLAHLANTSEKQDAAIKKWSETETEPPQLFVRILAVLLPVLLFISIAGYILNWHIVFSKLCFFFFSLNLMNIGFITPFMMKEIGKSDKISESIQQYTKMIQVFQKTSFTAEYLQNIQKELQSKNGQPAAGTALKELANYFEKLNTIANFFIFITLNGLFQYHFWVYKRLIQWKRKHQSDVWKWIETIGKVEALNALANFACNNPDYHYPEISGQNIIFFDNLGHPLLSKEKRVRNSIDFSEKKFVILTGSNMSGKSTFLRTVGINLVLGYAGVPIDAVKSKISPLPLWVSMRLTDSLSDSESFFYAEVKRLKKIVTEAQKQPVFVLLDEILKGTNSDDKKTGTIGVIEKLYDLQAMGIIATHDLEVCQTAYRYAAMINKCFEVEIIADELKFDYLLKEGVCQKKNATFIMKKMEII